MKEKCQCKDDCASDFDPNDISTYQQCSHSNCQKFISKSSSYHKFSSQSLNWIENEYEDHPLQFCVTHCHCCNPDHPFHEPNIETEASFNTHMEVRTLSASNLVEVEVLMKKYTFLN